MTNAELLAKEKAYRTAQLADLNSERRLEHRCDFEDNGDGVTYTKLWWAEATTFDPELFDSLDHFKTWLAKYRVTDEVRRTVLTYEALRRSTAYREAREAYEAKKRAGDD